MAQEQKWRVTPDESLPAGNGTSCFDGGTLGNQSFPEQHLHRIRQLQMHQLRQEHELQLLQQARGHLAQQQQQQSYGLHSRAGLETNSVEQELQLLQQARAQPDGNQTHWAAKLENGLGQGFRTLSQHQQPRQQQQQLQGGGHQQSLLTLQQQQHAAVAPLQSSSHHAQHATHFDAQQRQLAYELHLQKGGGQQHFPQMHPQVATAFAAGHELAMLQQASGQHHQPLSHSHQESPDSTAPLQGSPPMRSPIPNDSHGNPGFTMFPSASRQPPLQTDSRQLPCSFPAASGQPSYSPGNADVNAIGVGSQLGSQLLALSASADAWAAFGIPFGGSSTGTSLGAHYWRMFETMTIIHISLFTLLNPYRLFRLSQLASAAGSDPD